MPIYLENILFGIKSWVIDRLEEISYITASHLNSLYNRLENVETIIADEFEESNYSERALYTTHETDGDIIAVGKVFKYGSKVSLFIKNADTISNQQDVYYFLPYSPDSNYIDIINEGGLHEYSGIQFKIELTTQTINNIIYDVIKLNKYSNGVITHWGPNDSVEFSLDYIAETT